MDESPQHIPEHPAERLHKETAQPYLRVVEQHLRTAPARVSADQHVEAQRVHHQHQECKGSSHHVELIAEVETAGQGLLQLQEHVEAESDHVGLEQHDRQSPPDGRLPQDDGQFEEGPVLVSEQTAEPAQSLNTNEHEQVGEEVAGVDFQRRVEEVETGWVLGVLGHKAAVV